jgi:hypothetical protein
VCGSECTEPQYLAGLRDSLDNRAVDIRIVKHPRSPAQVVAYTVKIMTADFDEAWCVFDVDKFDIAEAVRGAGASSVEVAVSNPCFELWLLLHHEDHRAPLVDYRAVVARLRRHVPAYDKAELDFADYAERVGDAVTRAKALDATGLSHLSNPSTSVWRLVEKITA